jgi:predicted nucleic acid-binding Zn ribbon protein
MKPEGRLDVGGTPVPIGGALHEALRAQGLGFLLHEQKLRDRWVEVVGAPAAKVATLESLKDFVLHVKVEAAVWRNELHYQQEAIRQRANGILGADIVREIRLR